VLTARLVFLPDIPGACRVIPCQDRPQAGDDPPVFQGFDPVSDFPENGLRDRFSFKLLYRHLLSLTISPD